MRIVRGFLGLVIGSLLVAMAIPAVLLVVVLAGIGLATTFDPARALRRPLPQVEHQDPAALWLPTGMTDAEIWLALAIDYPNHQHRSET